METVLFWTIWQGTVGSLYKLAYAGGGCHNVQNLNMGFSVFWTICRIHAYVLEVEVHVRYLLIYVLVIHTCT